MTQRFFDYLNVTLLLILIFFLPLFDLPIFANSFGFSKLSFFIILLVLILASNAAKTLTTKKLHFELTHFDLPVVTFALTYLISGYLRTPNKMEAFFFPGTVSLVLACSILYFNLTQTSAKLKRTLVYSFVASIAVANVLFLVSLTKLNETLSLPELFKLSTYTPLDNLLTHFILTALAIILTLNLARKNAVHVRLLLWLPAVILVLGGFFGVKELLPTDQRKLTLGTYQESWGIALDSLKANPLLGTGPGNYTSAFTRYKSLNYNQTLTWDIPQSTGRNFYLTLVTETGLLGIIALVSLAITLLKALKEAHPYLTPLVLFLIVLGLFPISPLLLFALFFLLGLTSSPKRTFSFSHRYIILLSTLPLLLALASLVYSASFAFAAEVKYSQALTALSQNNGQTAYNSLMEAEKLSPYVDRYHAAFAEVNLQIARSLAAKKDLTEEETETLKQILDQTVNEGKVNVNLNQERSSNWAHLAGIYHAISPIIEGAGAYAITAYNQAIQLDQHNPNLYLKLGSLYYQLNQFEEAANTLELAVIKKPDLAIAHYNLALAYQENKETPKAVGQMEAVLKLVPKDSDDYKHVQSVLTRLKESLPKDTEVEPSEQKLED